MPTSPVSIPRMLCVLAAVLFAPITRGTELPELTEGVHETLVERVNDAQTREYDSIVSALDSFVAAHPKDAVVAVERCRFMLHFASSEDAAIESAYEDSEACQKELENGAYPDEAPVELFILDNLWGDEAKKRGRALLPPAIHWEPKRQAQLHEKLANTYAISDLIAAGPHAMAAMRLDPHSNVRLIAAEYLLRVGSRTAALKMIEGMPPEDWTEWNMGTAIEILVGMDAADAAVRLVEANPSVTPRIDARLLLARSLYASGRAEAASRIVKEASEAANRKEVFGVTSLREIFELSRDYGTTEEASAAYRRLRNSGFIADPFARHRLSLSIQHPRAPWQWEDTYGIGALVLAIGAMVLLPLLAIVPIHYRSVVKQLGGTPPEPPSSSSPWTLRQTWFALAVVFASSSVAFYFFDYPAFYGVAGSVLSEYGADEGISSDRALGIAVVVSSVFAAFVLLGLLKRVDLRSLVIGSWSVWRSVLTGIGASILLLVFAIFVNGFMEGASQEPAQLGSDTMRALQGIHSTYGAAALLLFVAVLVPVVEEFVFRGILLRTATRHIAFWAALLLQAVLFMSVHENMSAWPVIFTLALVAGWLARRSGGLLAPITMHATNNAFAAMSIIGLAKWADRMI